MQRLLMRHRSMETTMKYTQLKVNDMAGAVAAIGAMFGENNANPSDYFPNSTCFMAQERATDCNEDEELKALLAELNEKLKGLPGQDLASPGNGLQECATRSEENEDWWRRG